MNVYDKTMLGKYNKMRYLSLFVVVCFYLTLQGELIACIVIPSNEMFTVSVIRDHPMICTAFTILSLKGFRSVDV